MTGNTLSPARRWPLYGWAGLLLVMVSWALNWGLEGLRTHLGFFPLWLGYILMADAIVYMRKGTSLLHRSLPSFLVLFLVSAPFWWLFEVINLRSQYWFYEGRQHFTDLEYFLLASLSFSTVIPAVFETAELASTYRWVQRQGKGPVVGTGLKPMLIMFTTGWLMLALMLLWPRYFPYFVWISIYFIFEPVNVWLGLPSLVRYTAAGNWRPVTALFTGCLICGFFWEMWNYYSYPKWIYNVPYFNWWHVFEMPLFGYLGYLPFALELYAFYHLIMGLITGKKTEQYIQLD